MYVQGHYYDLYKCDQFRNNQFTFNKQLAVKNQKKIIV